MSRLCTLAALLIGTGLVIAQEKPPASENGSKEAPKEEPKKEPKPEPKPAPAVNEVEIRFHDGTTVRKVVVLQDNLEVVTRYGKLTVPTKDIRRIEFGFRLPPETAKKVADLIKDLGSNNFQRRQDANKELLALGRLAYPVLLKEAKNTDLESNRRAIALVEKIREKVPANQLRVKDYDMIHTKEFAIAGRITSDAIKARSQHFGELQLKVPDLRSMRSMAGSGEATVSVDATKYCSANNTTWLDTGFEVNAEVSLAITASGQVDLYANQGGGQYLSGPEGNANVGRSGTYLPGQLLGRIGTNGKVFTIGQRHDSTPTSEGKLFVRIVGINGSSGASGSFELKIASGY